MNERNEQSERKVNLIKFEIDEVIGVGDSVFFPSYGAALNRLPIFTIIENEAVPPLQSAMTDRAKQILIDQGFTRNKDAEFGRNNRDEVWTKKTDYAASQETVKLAKIVLHDTLMNNEMEIGILKYNLNAHIAILDEKKIEFERLQQSIKTATLWQRVKYLFGGEL